MKKTIKDYLFLLRYSMRYSGYLWWCVVSGLIWGTFQSFNVVVFQKLIFNKLESGSPYYEILIILVIMLVYIMFIWVFDEIFYNYIKLLVEQTLHEKMHSELFKKAMELDLACYDDPNFFNEYIWVLNESDGKMIEVSLDFRMFINRTVSSAVIIGVVSTIDITIVISIVAVVLLTVFMKYIQTKMGFLQELEMRPSVRRADYFNRTFYQINYAQDIRLSSIDKALCSEYENAMGEQLRIIKKYNIKLFCINIVHDFTSTVLLNVGITALLVYKIMVQGSISLGNLAVSLSAAATLFWLLNNLLNHINKLKRHSLFADRLRRFLEYRPIINSTFNLPLPQNFESIILKNVYFGYSADNMVLRNINIEIKHNDKIALVGYNGAGKSTLIKLLMRLYDPKNGQILWNGTNICDINIEMYRSAFATVFQDFQIFAVSVAENVKTDIVTEEDGKRICDALKKSNLYECISALDGGINAELTKEFDQNGINLSGGEMQKLAIARAFMKQSVVVIMDEPSSALDPISEYDLNQTMMSAVHDKTVIMISHRLSTTVMADKIYMLDNGEIVEQGNHQSLMKLNGKYAEMFNKQAEKYRLGTITSENVATVK